MTIFCISADRGIPWDGTKGASVHWRSIVKALSNGDRDVVAFSKKTATRRISDRLRLVSLESPDVIETWAAALGSPHFIYERYSLGSTIGLTAARCLGVPFVLEVNSALVEEARIHRPGTLAVGDSDVERRLWREADHIAVVSSVLAEQVAAVRGHRNGVEVCWNGCDEELLSNLPSPEARTRPLLAFLGHPKPWHGALALPDILVGLDRRGFTCDLLVIGGGPGAEGVKTRCVELGVADRLEITGELPQDRALARLRDATISLAPYGPIKNFYFCPLKIIESMAAGVPCVTTRQGDIPAILDGTGKLAEPGDIDGIVAACAELLADEDARLALATAARRRARTSLTWNALAERLRDAVRPRAIRGTLTS